VAFLDINKAFNTTVFDGPNYKLVINNFPSYLVKTYLPAYMVGISKRPSKQQHSMVRHGGWGFSEWNNSPVLFSLYITTPTTPNCLSTQKTQPY
jgi:hypothetical protein